MKEKEKSNNKNKRDFIDVLVEFILGNAESRKIKEITRKINKFSNKYYKASTRDLTGDFATFIIKLYQSSSEIVSILASMDKEMIKRRLIETNLNERQLDILEKIDENALKEEAEFSDIKELSAKLKDLLKEFSNDFSNDKIALLENQYIILLELMEFFKFDYISFLRKFSAKIPTNANITNINLDSIKLQNVHARIVIEQLKDFQEYTLFAEENVSWDKFFETIYAMKDIEPRDAKEWTKLVKTLKAMRANSYIINIIRHAENSSAYAPISKKVSGEKIIESYILSIKNRANKILSSILSQKREKVSGEIIKSIFGNNPTILAIDGLDEESISNIEEKLGSKPKYLSTLSYIKTYIDYIFKTEVKEFQDLILIRATWINKKDNQDAHGTYHKIIELEDKIISFENSFHSDSTYGNKIKKILHSKENSSMVKKQNEEFIASIDKEMFEIIKEFLNSAVYLIKRIKALMEDYDRKKNFEIISSWREIDAFCDKRTKQILLNTYKKMYYMAKLIQNNTK